MTPDGILLGGDSPGSKRVLTAFRFGRADARPKAYLQAGLHADEMPGVLVLQHLLPLLEQAEAAGELVGQVVVVPVANPIGLAQWISQKPMGRFETETMQNYNRHYPDLGDLAADRLAGRLTRSPEDNLRIIRETFGEVLSEITTRTDLQQLRVELLKLSHDADHVLDLHCDTESVMHLYASPARPDDTAALCRATGARLAMIAEVSGGNAFDEAHTAPWAALKARYGARFPIPDGCFSSTVEYRGQLEVSDAQARTDAMGLFAFLAERGYVTTRVGKPADAGTVIFPLSGSVEVHAPQGGVISWTAAPGDWVAEGDLLAHVTDPVTRLRLPVLAPFHGLMFRRELWRQCLRGQSLCNVSGPEPKRSGYLLSD
jgi:uncharacterized protein